MKAQRAVDKTLEKQEGFTLLELLIVLGILAILAAVVIFALNPVETLRKSRDSQRVSDLNTIKSAMGTYITSTTTPPELGGTSNTGCKASDGGAYVDGDRIYFSAANNAGGNSSTTDKTFDGSVTVDVPKPIQQNTVNHRLVDGTGWLPVNLKTLTGGAPIDSWPTDPSNTFANTGTDAGTDSTISAVTNAALVYRYMCEATNFTYEVDANLESAEFTTGLTDKETTDGGNNTLLYEVGTGLTLLGGGDNF